MTAEMEESEIRTTADILQRQYDVEQFLYLEAQLLDDWHYREWFNLLADDLRYWMPVRKNRLRRQRIEDEVAPRGIEMAHFDDDKKSMEIRIMQKETGEALGGGATVEESASGNQCSRCRLVYGARLAGREVELHYLSK